MSKVTIYSIAVNKDTESDTLSCLFLVSTGEKYERDKRRNKKIWHRFFCGNDLESLLAEIDKYTNWKNTKFKTGMLLNKDMLKLKVQNREIVENKFYSYFYILEDYKEISKKDIERVSAILSEFNDKKVLYSKEQITKIQTELSDKLKQEFGAMSGVIEKFIWHKVMTDDEKLAKQELYGGRHK